VRNVRFLVQLVVVATVKYMIYNGLYKTFGTVAVAAMNLRVLLPASAFLKATLEHPRVRTVVDLSPLAN
jgi:hypothetical protein